MNNPEIYFDADGKLNLIHPNVHSASEKLSYNAKYFVEDLNQMNSTMNIFLKYFNEYTKTIDKIKSQVWGFRTLIEIEQKKRITNQNKLKSEIMHIEEDIDKLTEELNSLNRISIDQETSFHKHAKTPKYAKDM